MISEETGEAVYPCLFEGKSTANALEGSAARAEIRPVPLFHPHRIHTEALCRLRQDLWDCRPCEVRTSLMLTALEKRADPSTTRRHEKSRQYLVSPLDRSAAR